LTSEELSEEVMEIDSAINELIGLLFKLKSLPIEACEDDTCEDVLMDIWLAQDKIERAIQRVEEEPF